jgi:hypothetical protein
VARAAFDAPLTRLSAETEAKTDAAGQAANGVDEAGTGKDKGTSGEQVANGSDSKSANEETAEAPNAFDKVRADDKDEGKTSKVCVSSHDMVLSNANGKNLDRREQDRGRQRGSLSRCGRRGQAAQAG